MPAVKTFLGLVLRAAAMAALAGNHCEAVRHSLAAVALVACWLHGEFGTRWKMAETLVSLCNHFATKKAASSGLSRS
jgi:hypothetical protein